MNNDIKKFMEDKAKEKIKNGEVMNFDDITKWDKEDNKDKSNNESFIDRDYIKLCAEIAYNDVIIESVLNEEDNSISAKERIKNIFKSFISFLKNLWNKFFNFLTRKIKEFKNKLEEIRKKREEKKKEVKQESTSLYNQLMEMVLTEGKENIRITNIATVYKELDERYNSIEKLLRNLTSKVLIKISDIQDEYYIGRTNDYVEYSGDQDHGIYNEFKNTDVSLAFKLSGYWKDGESISKAILRYADYNISEIETVLADNISNQDKYVNALSDLLDKYTDLQSEFKKCMDNCNKQSENVKVDNPKVAKYIQSRLSFLGQAYSGAISGIAKNIGIITKALAQYEKDMIKINDYDDYEKNKKFKPEI